MPLVLTENEETESGITYEDRTGVSYQYPWMYRRIIQPGERFLYYRGRRRRGGGRAPQVYFGTGLVGRVEPDPNREDRFVCQILDYRPFPVPVPFKNASGEYCEPGGKRRGHFQRGVRMIADGDFQRILDAAQESAEAAVQGPIRASPGRPSYASPETAKAVDDFAVQAALNEVRRRYPRATVELQPRNNPGFDILVQDSRQRLYVEVKGTERGSPQFFATEGEVQFSIRHPEGFRLIVVYRIDIEAGTYELFWHEGAISAEAGFRLKPVQWACEAPRSDRR